MEMWVRVVILVAAAILAIINAVWWNKQILRRLLHAASRKSGWRAFGVALLYHLFLFLAGIFISIVVTVLDAVIDSPVPATVMTAIAIAGLAPFTLVFFPDKYGPSTVVQTLYKFGSSRVVARVLAITGAVSMFFLLFGFGSAAVAGILTF